MMHEKLKFVHRGRPKQSSTNNWKHAF